tara:strand:+ start:79 stop:609 length:531 start_codon:yes stop_codon:yes gene_type:complete
MNSTPGPFFPSSAKVEDLSVSLLETSPHRYFEILEVLSMQEDPALRRTLKEKLNETPYETWHSNHVLSLSRLVGRLNQGAIDKFGVGGSFYGSTNIEGISEELAGGLLKLMVECGVDIRATDYYGNSITEILEQGELESRFYRIGNVEYFNEVDLMIHRGPSCSINEGVPPTGNLA